MSAAGARTPQPRMRVAIAGNPNSGKTTLFNVLTGLNQKVGNYSGVTIERKEGRWARASGDTQVIDLPGAYSLEPHSPEEAIARDVLAGRREDTPRPDAIIAVVDATNLERNLYLVLQLMETGLPLVIALNMMDLLGEYGLELNVAELQARLGVPVVPIVARKKRGIEALDAALDRACARERPWRVSNSLEQDIADAASRLRSSEGVAISALCRADSQVPGLEDIHARQREAGEDFFAAVITARYAWIHQLADGVLHQTEKRKTLTDRLDVFFLHRVFGYLIFLGLMLLVFDSVFRWASYPMGWLDAGVAWLSGWIGATLPPGFLSDLLTQGVLGGVGSVVVFLPQILILFFFINLLEDSGYMARAAFLMDRLMWRVGLSGKSFIPMLSSFACAIPGIMATRTISDPKDRMVTLLVAPLMTCSARLPVYTLLIAAVVPNRDVLGFLSLQGLVMASLYLGGVVAAMAVAYVLRRSVLKGARSTMVMELPPYRAPQLATVVRAMKHSAGSFLRRAGTIILGVSIALWLLSSYPRAESGAAAGQPTEQLAQSYAGRLGRMIEPVIAPLGFDWKIGVSLVSTFAAREVFIGTLGTIYNVAEADENTVSLREAISSDTNARTGGRLFSGAMVAALLVFYIFAAQCMGTIAVVRRETATWRWPLFLLGYTYALAWVLGWVAYRVGVALGWT